MLSDLFEIIYNIIKVLKINLFKLNLLRKKCYHKYIKLYLLLIYINY